MPAHDTRVRLDSAGVKAHLGIPYSHSVFKAARNTFQTTGQKTLILIISQGCLGEPRVISLVDRMRWEEFSDTPERDEIVRRLEALRGCKLRDRELFIHALHQLYMRYDPLLEDASVLAPVGPFQNGCFQLLFDYAPGTYCIAATAAIAANGGSVQVRYSKYGDVNMVWEEPAE